MPTPCSILTFYRNLLSRSGRPADEKTVERLAIDNLLASFGGDVGRATRYLKNLHAEPEEILGAMPEGYLFTANDLAWAIEERERT